MEGPSDPLRSSCLALHRVLLGSIRFFLRYRVGFTTGGSAVLSLQTSTRFHRMRSNRRSSMTSMTSSTLFIDRFPIENDRFTPDDLPFLSSFPLVDSNEGDSRSSNDFSVVHWIFSVWRGISCFCLPLQDLIELDAALNWDLPSFGGDLERDLLNHSGRKTAARSKLCARWVGTEVDRWHSVFFYRVFGNSFIRPHKMSGRHSLDFLHPIALV